YSKEVEKFMREDSIRAIAQLVEDDKVLQSYFQKNNIKAQKTDKGTYVEITEKGNGPACEDGKLVSINYTGKLLTGKTFDSNVDSSFRHVQPYIFPLGQGQVIKGWDDGLKMFNKGGKGRLFVPSALAYGSRGRGQDIKANDNLMFEVEVVDVKDAAQ